MLTNCCSNANVSASNADSAYANYVGVPYDHAFAASDATNFTNVQSASSSYFAANDENLTLAGIYANSYAANVNSDENVESSAKNSLDNFYLTHADTKYSNAFSNASSAASAEPNNAALAKGYGVNVFNHALRYITTTNTVWIHNDSHFTYGKDNNHVATIPAGVSNVKVLGVGFDTDGTTRYVVNYKGTKGFITANPAFNYQMYLDP